MIDVFGIARIQHADTGKIYEIDRNDLAFETNGTDDRSMGMEIEHIAIFNHNQLGELIWTVWEYPVGMFNHNDCNIGKHKLLEDFHFGIKHEKPDDDEADNQDRIDELVEWFYENYEDPAESVTYVSGEGGYQWQNGGPCDASDELQGKFPNEHDDIIEAAVEEIESGGTYEWSPIQDVRDSDTKEMFPEHYLKDIDDKLNTLIDNAPESTTDPVFALDDNNPLYIKEPPDNQPVNNQDGLLNGLRTITDDLLESLAGTNRYSHLIPIIEKYKEAISGNQMSISRIYVCGVRLDNMAQIAMRDIELGGLPPNTEECLKTVIRLHGSYIMSNPEGRRLVEDSAAYRQPAEQIEGLKEAIEKLSNNIKNNTTLFSEDVRELVPNVLMDIGTGEHPERSNQSIGNTLSNMFSGILGWIRRRDTHTILEAIETAFVDSDLGIVIFTIGTDIFNAAWGFVVNFASSVKTIATSFVAQSPWLVDVVQFLERIIPMIPGF